MYTTDALRALVNSIMKHRIPLNAQNFLRNSDTNFFRRTMLYDKIQITFDLKLGTKPRHSVPVIAPPSFSAHKNL
jgi:hypothetical protein